MTEEMQDITLPDEDEATITEETPYSVNEESDRMPEADAVNTVSEQHHTERQDNRAHLTSSVPRVAKVPKGALTKGEMAEIRKIFGDMDDAEIIRLYKRVTK